MQLISTSPFFFPNAAFSDTVMHPRVQVCRQLLLLPTAPLRSPPVPSACGVPYVPGWRSCARAARAAWVWWSRRKNSSTRLFYIFHAALKVIKWQEPNFLWLRVLWHKRIQQHALQQSCVYVRFTYVRMPVGVHLLHVSSLRWRKKKSQYWRLFLQDDTLSTYAFSKGFWCTPKWF